MERRIRSGRNLGAIVCLLALLSAGHTEAATKTWNYAGDGSWSEAAKWNPEGVPVTGDTVVLKGTYGHEILCDVYSAGVNLAQLSFYAFPMGLHANLLLHCGLVCDPVTLRCLQRKSYL